MCTTSYKQPGFLFFNTHLLLLVASRKTNPKNTGLRRLKIFAGTTGATRDLGAIFQTYRMQDGNL